jgi:multidrug resistance protein, MATE family
MRFGILGLWLVSLPGCYLAGFIFHGGPVGLRFGFLSGFIFSGVILWWRWYNKTRELKLRRT